MLRISACVGNFALPLLLSGPVLAVTVNINSGDPAFPFPQFLHYSNPSATLGNIGTKWAPGISHAEMEQTIRDAYQIMMNRADHPGGGVGGVNYVHFGSTPDCSEGDGYAMIAAAAMADKTTFDGLWLWVHDNRMNKVTSYLTGAARNPDYQYSRLPAWTGTAGNSAADGDFDIALGLTIAHRQWGEFMGINDAGGNPISYKHDLIEFLKGMTDTIPFSENNRNLITGDIGLDGYFKGGDTWQELTDWASRTNVYSRGPFFPGPTAQHVDYTCPAYFREWRDLLKNEDPAEYAWNIHQFERAEASSDWLMGQHYAGNPASIPYAGWVALSPDNSATFSNFNEGEDFRFAWRTILNYVWHGNPGYTWDPVAHQIIEGRANDFEQKMGERFAAFLKDNTQSPWGNACATGRSGSYRGVSVIAWQYDVNGGSPGNFFLNWLDGTGAPSAVAAQDYDLMGKLYRRCAIEWEGVGRTDEYLTSLPTYYHGFFRLLGMMILSGNHLSPSQMIASANMKVYLDTDKTFALEGDQITYTIDYRNYGSVDASSVTITDKLPDDFVFVSATGGGSYSSSAHTVTWNVGTVQGFRSGGGVDVTTGSRKLVVRIDNATQEQYANTVDIDCSNGSGWTSNEYANTLSPILKRSVVDMARRALVIDKSATETVLKPGEQTDITIDFENSSTAGFLNGGHPDVNFSYTQEGSGYGGTNRIAFRLFSDAAEPYIDYGAYRVSYYMHDDGLSCYSGDPGCGVGWGVMITHVQGLSSETFKIVHESIPPGEDANGKWNQRLVVQFDDPADPARPQQNWSTMATVTRQLEKLFGLSGRIHLGLKEPLKAELQVHASDWRNIQWDDDWSWAPPAAGGAEYGYPITPNFSDPDPDNPGVPVTKLNPAHCEEVHPQVDNILVEEWDGYTWRRVAGNSPMPGREVTGVVIRDTLPDGLEFVEFLGSAPLGVNPSVSGKVITWSVSKLLVAEGGSISYRAVATGTCPIVARRVMSTAWIEADTESPKSASVEIGLTCDGVLPSPVDPPPVDPPPVDPPPVDPPSPPDTVSVGATPRGCFFGDQLSVELAASVDGADIWYRLDGTAPVPGAAGTSRYTGSIQISETATLMAIAEMDSCVSAGAITETYTLLDIDCVPVSSATYLDYSGNGRADRIALSLETSSVSPDSSLIESHPELIALPQDLDIDRMEFHNDTLYLVLKGDGVEPRVGDEIGILAPDFSSTGYERKDGYLNPCVLEVLDGVAPVVVKAGYRPQKSPRTGRHDTLTVTFSEPVSFARAPADTAYVLFDLTRGTLAYTFELEPVAGERTATVTFRVVSIRGAGSVEYPADGDLLRIRVGEIEDTGGNVQNSPHNPQVHLEVDYPELSVLISVGPVPFTPPDALLLVARPDKALPGSVGSISGKVWVYDCVGNAMLSKEEMIPTGDGAVSCSWDGRNTNGRIVGSGVYLAVIEIQDALGRFERYRRRVGVGR